ncbi:MAG: DNA topoisomerase IV subunit A [Gammaproteobacteria bacterium]|nr:DNA topoisomerase IV subunit A [Gammaproteobacteria bacterium]
MNKKQKTINEKESKHEVTSLGEFSESAYLNYSMYVILDRALPSITDGLKPVQRRIIYAMDQLGLTSQSKFKKSARTIGDVLGKYHPHGDSACYEAMVMLAQGFSYNYPLVEGQGNWGTQDDPKSFAAMRYTESRLTKYSDLFLSDIEKNTVSWSKNFDGTLLEPKHLPSKIPNILINGSSGIAVGMSTDIPSHNIGEIIDATTHLIDKPKSSISDLLKIIKGPDFPTEGEIISKESDLNGIYNFGTGNIKLRATYFVEGKNIVIKSIPYQSHTTKIIEQIQDQIANKKIIFIDNISDDSDQEHPVRIIIRIKGRSHSVDDIMSHLFFSTDLEKNLRVNLNIIGTDNKPSVKNIREILTEWVKFRLHSVKNKLQWELDKIQERIHILEAYVKVYKYLDKIIKLIRTEDNPKKKIISLCKLTEKQYEAIINMRIRSLAKLQEESVLNELKKLKNEEKSITLLLSSSNRLKTYLKKELNEIKKDFGRSRKTSINNQDTHKSNEIKVSVSISDLTVIISKNGWIKFHKGHNVDITKLDFKTGDSYYQHLHIKSNNTLAFFDQHGMIYNMASDNYQVSRGQGEPLSKYFKLQDGTQMIGMVNISEKLSVLNCSSMGYGFICVHDEMFVKNKKGKKLINVKKSNAIKPINVDLDNDKYYVIITSENYMLIEKLSEIPIMPRGKGVKLINIPKTSDETIVYIGVLRQDQVLEFSYTSRKSRVMDHAVLQNYIMKRTRRGKKIEKKFLLEKGKTTYNIK